MKLVYFNLFEVCFTKPESIQSKLFYRMAYFFQIHLIQLLLPLPVAIIALKTWAKISHNCCLNTAYKNHNSKIRK